MGHTEGPWVACSPGESDWSDKYWEIEDPYGHTATVYGDDAEAEANARLIAAAPELLAALRQCLPIVDAYRRAFGGDGDVSASYARSVIAKVEVAQ